MADTGIRLIVKIDTSRTLEQQGEECRRAYEAGLALTRRQRAYIDAAEGPGGDPFAGFPR
jgi:hypothetical protein